MTQKSDFFGIRCLSLPSAAFLSLLTLSCALLMSALPSSAQVENGISGTVTDATGAVITGAQITVSNDATGVIAKATTSSAGTFTVVGLNPGPHHTVAFSEGIIVIARDEPQPGHQILGPAHRGRPRAGC